MLIAQLERRLSRLNADIAARQAALTDLKIQRKALRRQLEQAKRAARNGQPRQSEPVSIRSAGAALIAGMTKGLHAVMPGLAKLLGWRSDWG
jgi:hypothetical protein